MPSITKYFSTIGMRWKKTLVSFHTHHHIIMLESEARHESISLNVHAQHYTIMFTLRHVIEANSCKFSCPASHNSCQPCAQYESNFCDFSCPASQNIFQPLAWNDSNSNCQFWWKNYVWPMDILPWMISMTRPSHVNRRGTPFAPKFSSNFMINANP